MQLIDKLTTTLMTGVLLLAMTRLRSGHMTLMKKGEKDMVGTTVAEAGLNIALAELRLDPSFRTHWHYRIGTTDPKKKGWVSPRKKREAWIAPIKDLEIEGLNNGTYRGRTAQGEFKFHLAPVYGAKENSKTQALRESGLYYRAEVVAHVGDGKKPEDDAYRKVSVMLER